MDDGPSDRVSELLRRYQQGSPSSKKRERMASPEAASAKKSMRDEEGGTGKFLMRAARPASVHQDRFPAKTFEQRPEPIQPNYKPIQPNDNEKTISSNLDYTSRYRAQDRSYVPMVTQDDVALSRRKINTSLDSGHVTRKEDEADGSDSAEDTPSSPRASSPPTRAKSPEPELAPRPSSPGSPVERSSSPPIQKSPAVSEERSLSPVARSVSPPTEKISQSPEESTEVTSATYDEVEDSLASLDALAEGIGKDAPEKQSDEEPKTEAKERSRSTSSLEAADLDFSVIESSSQLDVGVSKDRAILRQKGSLAKRRKPTRSSMRSRGNEDDMFTVDIPVDDKPNEVRNGHDKEAKENIEQKEKETKKAPIKNSFLLPGLGEQPKLRSNAKVAVSDTTTPITATTPVSSNESNPAVSTTPAWMVEARQKRQSRQVVEDTSNLKRDPNAEKPAWMREALAKKRRSMDLLQKKDLKAKDEEDKNTAAPWIKDRPLKHIDNAVSTEQVTDIDNNNLSNRGPDVQNVGGATIFSTVPSTRYGGLTKADVQLHSKIDGDRKIDSLSISKSEKELMNEKDLKNGNNKWLSDSPRSRDLLTPIKRSSVDMNSNPLEGQDENTPPENNTSTDSDKPTSAVISSLEQSNKADILRNKAQLPPLSTASITSSNNKKESGETEDSVPSWKAEIQLRRRSKVFIPSQKPDQPIKLAETPKWKLDLAERTKNKKDDTDVPKPKTEILTQTTTPQPHATPSSIPPWQRELAERKKRNSLNPRALEPLEKQSANKEPEWAGLAEKRRSRIANKNPLPDIGDTNSS